MSPALLDYRFDPVGDQALMLTFGSASDMDLDARANAAAVAMAQALVTLAPVWLEDVLPSLRAVLICYDALQTTPAEVQRVVEGLLSADKQADTADRVGRNLRLPVCYDAEFGLDLPDVAQRCGCSLDDVIAWHQGSAFRVYMLGFMPGAPYLGGLNPRLSLPRRAEPRTAIPAGSVAIVGQMGMIYPKQSPGGWHILGRCPLPLFDAIGGVTLLAPGDKIAFQAVDRSRFDAIAANPQAYDIEARA